MLQAGGQHTLDRFFVDCAVEILPARPDAGGAFDICVDFRDRQAAFIVNRDFFGRVENFRVDEDPWFLLERPVRVLVSAVFGAHLRFGVLVHRL